MLNRQVTHALKALLELAQEPARWRSVNDLAASQELPAPMLEQLLLRLRGAGLVVSRRGRKGGYRLARPAQAIPLAAILASVGAVVAAPELSNEAEDRVLAALQRRLRHAVDRELADLTLEELLFDLRSTRAALREEGGLLIG